jgi:hypothetical protein
VRPFLPSLLLPQFGVTGPTPVTAHVDHCPTCQADLDAIAALKLTTLELLKAARYLAGEKVELADAVYPVLDKIEHGDVSDVLTRMRLDQTGPVEQHLLMDSAVIDVKHRSAEKAVSQRRVLPRRAVSVWITSGIAAAILFALLLVIPAGDLKAVDVAQLYTTLENVRNVHIQKFGGDRELESIWISEGLNAYLFQRDEDAVFVDKDAGKVYQWHQGAMQLVSQGGEMELERPWGLLPFKHISQLPASYDWTYIADTVLEDDLKVRIYEWTWTESPSNRLQIKHIWRGYLDVRSDLPYRIECLDAINSSPAELIMEMRITYPSDAECREVFNAYGFKALDYGHQFGPFKKVPPASNPGSTEVGLVLSTWPSAKTALNVPPE